MTTEIYIKIFTIALIAIFFLLRSRFTKHYKKFKAKMLVKYFIAIILFYFYLEGYFDFANLEFNLYLRVIGLAIIFIGMGLFFSAHQHLSNNWSPVIEKKFSKSRKLINSGPYKYIRHPIYTASFIVFLGLFLLTANWLLIGIPLLILITFYSIKIPKEERELKNNFGKKYLEYMKTTGGLIPKIK